MNLLEISLLFILFKITAIGAFECDENSCTKRSRRDKISENLIIGMDYLGKPRVVCHCDVKDAWRLTAKYIQASERSHVIKVRDVGPKSQEQKKDLIYAPSCCKIDLSNPNKLYSYPFTLRLLDLDYTDHLADASTPEYQELKKQLVDGISKLLASEGCVISIEVSKFRNGSVLADMALTIKGLISPCIIDTLKEAVESGNIGGLRVEVFPELSPPEASTQLPTTTEQLIPPSATSSQTPAAGATPSLTTVPSITAKPTLVVTAATTLPQTPGTATATASPPAPDTATAQSPAPGTATALPPAPNTATALPPAPDTATALPQFADNPISTSVSPRSTQTPISISALVLEQIPSAKPTPAPTSTIVTAKLTPTQTHTTALPSKSSSKLISPSAKISATVSPPPASPVMRPEIPVDYRPTTVYSSNKPGKEYKVAIDLTEKAFDAALNNPSSSQFLELKELLEKSLTEIFKINPEFLSIKVVSFRPAVFKQPQQNPTANNVHLRDEVKLQGVEVTLDIKFREERPGQLTPLETQLKIGTIATHKVSPELAGVIIKEQNAMRPPLQACPNQCAPTCAPICSGTCCALTRKSTLKH